MPFQDVPRNRRPPVPCPPGLRQEWLELTALHYAAFIAYSPVQKTDPLLHTREHFPVNFHTTTHLSGRQLWVPGLRTLLFSGLKRKLLQILEQAGVSRAGSWRDVRKCFAISVANHDFHP
jgi:hypothetical protein